MGKVIEKAKKTGVGVVGVKNSNHFGVTAYYTNLAAAENCIGFAFTNTAAVVVPFGSAEPSLGTNPIAISVPRGGRQEPRPFWTSPPAMWHGARFSAQQS
jgi:LDH2 family malate/lactate/ureidoglycolate dehydrogenase